MPKMVKFDGVEISEQDILAKGYVKERDVRDEFYAKWDGASLYSEAWGTQLKLEGNDNTVNPACLKMSADEGPYICRSEDARSIGEQFLLLAEDMAAVERDVFDE